ncbi:TPA: restriction endonuclease subunit S [Vibrio vulnificus]|uniref:restriction endonuclease subunit S n=1 Tax=Vibrio vulnificus TaxID=672 RepID=UPI0002D3B4A7|nr:restriction endonuclease subunit S [Vibrio vulnificus]EIV8488800.1 restriction endonuclease subunit S [Vibrio vulnificus]HAS8598776.1 restriction endonuclease subunit S [Vibrio vulnificus]
MSSDFFPNSWKLCPLEDVMDAIIDYRGKTPKKTESGVPLVTAKIVKDGYVQTPTEFIAEDSYETWMVRGLPEVGDVVLTTEAPLGEAAQLTDSNVALAQRIVTLRGKKGVLSNDYLLCAMQSNYVQHQLEARATGSTVKGIKQSELRKVILPVPPFEEQQRISNILKSISDKILLNSKTNQTLEQIAQAIFKSWFVDFDPVKAKMETLAVGGSADDAELAAMSVISAKTVDELNSLKASNPEAFNKLAQTAALFPSAMQDSELGEIPEGWDNGTIEDVMQFSSERVDVSGLNLRNYISTENMLENKRGITTASSLPSVSSVPAFNENEILISNIRPYFKKIWLTEFKGGRSPDVLGFSLLDPEETEFAYNLLYQDRFFEYMMTTSKGAKMPRGDKSAIKQFSFPLPQKELRLVFSKHVRAFYPMIKNTNKESEHLHALRDALLPELLSGNLGRS